MQLNISLAPSQIEILSQPNQTISQVYQVTNNSNTIVYLSTSVDRWQPTGNDGSVDYVADVYPAAKFSLLNANLKLGQTFSLPPGQSQQLVLQTTPILSTSNDAYYTFFVTQNLLPSATTGQTTGGLVSGKIGSHLLITTSPTKTASPSAKIDFFTTSPRFKDIFFTPITFQSQVTNLSQHYFPLNGAITITKNGRNIQKLTLVPDNVLSQHFRQLRCLDRRSSNEGGLPTTCTVSPPLWPGFYTATLSLDPSIASTPVSVSFFVLPYYLFIITIVILISIFVYFHKFRQTSP